MSQRLMLGPFLSNKFLYELFLFIKNKKNILMVITNIFEEATCKPVENLKRDMKVILKWFKRTSVKINFQKTQFVSLNPLMTNVPHHIKTSQLVCNAYQLTHFYMMGNIYRY